MHRNVLLNLFKYRTIFHQSKISKNYLTQYKQMRLCHTEPEQKDSSDNDMTGKTKTNPPLVFGMKYQVFQDQDAPVILDVTEENDAFDLEEFNTPQEIVDPYQDINLKRGLKGVFDIEDLVDILNKQKAKNLFVVTVPQEYAYVDYLMIATGRSQKHMVAMAEFVRSVAKKKNVSSKQVPRIEGRTSPDWIALDIGNIVLHIFSNKTRAQYDLESLWSLGVDCDDITNREILGQEDPMAHYNAFIDEFQPAERE